MMSGKLTVDSGKLKKRMISILPFLFFFYLADKLSQAFRLAAGANISEKALHIQSGFAAAFSIPLLSFNMQDLLVGVIGAALIALALRIKRANAKKYRRGVEYSSARWAA